MSFEVGCCFVPVLLSQVSAFGLPGRGGSSVLWRIVRGVALVLITVAVVMAFFEERFIFFPSTYDGGDAWRPPGGDYEDVFFESSDGTQLHAWYFPHAVPRANILYCHGNGGDITGRLEIARQLVRLGASVFLFDYRGYGRSEGSPTERGVLSDARAARKEFSRRAGVEESEIVLLGRSLGGGVAVDLAARDGARGLILESTFTDLADVAAVHYRWLPTRWLLRTRFDSIGKISDYTGQLLQFHGTEDRIVPVALGKRLFAAASGEAGKQKTLFLWEEGDHNQHPPPDYYQAMDQFLGRLP